MHDLPKRCFVVLPGMPAGQNVAVCVCGESGVRLTQLDFGGDEAAARIVRELNRALGIAPSQVRAMWVGCLFGWETPETAGAMAPRPPHQLLH